MPNKLTFRVNLGKNILDSESLGRGGALILLFSWHLTHDSQGIYECLGKEIRVIS